MRFLSLILVALFSLTACQATPQERRELCEHFAGEEPYDAERAAYLNKMYEELVCREFELSQFSIQNLRDYGLGAADGSFAGA